MVKTTGDGVHAVFPRAERASRAAVDGQLLLDDEAWGRPGPIRVRMGLHSGTAERATVTTTARSLNRAARLMSVAHGGQVVVSQLTEQLVRDSVGPEVELVDLGEHRLRDLAEPMHVFQVTHRGARPRVPGRCVRSTSPAATCRSRSARSSAVRGTSSGSRELDRRRGGC